MPRIPCLLLMLWTLAAVGRPAVCQQNLPAPADLKALLSGASGVPLTVRLGDLTGDWRRLSIGLDAGAAPSIAVPQGTFIVGAGGVIPTPYYTQGRLATVGADQFLVAYRVPPPKFDPQAMPQPGDTLLPRLTPDTPLTLVLFNLHSVSSLSEIRPLDVTQEVAASDQAASRDAANRSLTDLKQPFLPNTSLSRRRLVTFAVPADVVVYYQAGPTADGTRAVLFLDGHARRIPEADWPRLKAAPHVPTAVG